jgi:GTP pyrophosphokinase
MTLEEFVKEIEKYNPKADFKLISQAFNLAKVKHEGQKRVSGEEFINHPIQVARILIQLKADSATICAALLHDSLEDTTLSLDEIQKQFGEEIAELVEGVTKITDIDFESKEEYKAENLRKVLLATTKDVRVMLIKLADRLHNMRTLKYVRLDKQKRIAEETLHIFAPIAHKLGIHFMKGEFEDLALRYMHPDVYKKLSKRISEKREEREKKTLGFIETIKNKLKEHGIKGEIYGRAKYFHSIYQKMKKEDKTFNEIYDLIAIRIIVETIPDCYRALGLVHELWKPMPRRFKDYVSVPKANGYQSLHTSVMGSHGKILEIQIRTWDMHHMAEEGIAAHWRYKHTERDKKFDKKVAWLKQLLEWKRTADNAKDFVETLKIDLFENEIVVFTPNGDPISLPENSTPVDFAFEVHTNIGLHCSKAEVNNKLVTLDYILKSGDIVHIIMQKNAKPSRNWLTFVKTSKARSKIRSYLGIKVESDPKIIRQRQQHRMQLINMIEITGKKVPVKFSGCCNPDFKEPILAYYTKDGKITIHKKDCPNIHTLDQNKRVNVRWKEEPDKGIFKLRTTVVDRVGLLSDILNIISDTGINIDSINSKAKKDKISITFSMRVPTEVDMDEIIRRIKSIEDVIDVKRG